MTEDIRRKLADEVKVYKAIVEQIDDPNLNIPKFWKLHEEKLPIWAMCAKRLILLQPSSASVERVWAMFSNFFDPGSENSPLIDYIYAYLMIRYNSRSSEGDSKCTV